MSFSRFDRSRLIVRPLDERTHDFTLDQVLDPTARAAPYDNPRLDAVVDRIVAARDAGKPVILMMGAHLIKVGLSRFVIDLLERGIITHVAGNGACAIHDFEMALIGATTESVADYIRTGQFGLWRETGRINDIVRGAADSGTGFGEALGREILDGDYPHCDVSIYAAALRLGLPATVHVSIGYDIVHEHPNCDAAAIGAASYTDFLIFTHAVSGLEGGVMLNYGTAIMGPEVYLKALSMVRNVAAQEGRQIAHFTTAVFDLIALGDDLESEAPKSDPRYYYRPFKTILIRTVRDGGESYYIQGDHTVTLPNLHHHVVSRSEAG